MIARTADPSVFLDPHHLDEMSPQPHVFKTLGSQLLALLGKVMKPLGGGILLQEVTHWGQSLKFYNLVSLPVFFSLYSLLPFLPPSFPPSPAASCMR